MSAREFIFDELVVLCTHACLRERLAKSPQRWGNAHQGYAQVAHFHFDRVEEPDSTHGPAPFFTSHSKYLGSFIDLFARINPHPTRRLDATQASLEKCHSREGEWPLRTQETQDLNPYKNMSCSPESLRPSVDR